MAIALAEGTEATMCRVQSIFDDPSYNHIAMTKRQTFITNRPFPHIVLDDFLPLDVAECIANAYPDPRNEELPWRTHVNANVSRRFIEDTAAMAPALRNFAAALMSRQFLLFLETMSGIESLIGDPYYIGGGAMVTGPGEFLKVHADFNWHHKLQAHRRLNALLYLTPDWVPDWGGELELWSKDMSEMEQSIVPKFNRIVVFEVSDSANHGQPRPLRTPPGVYRRVLSAFYYTTRTNEAEWKQPHFTQYKPENSPYSAALLQEYQRRGQRR